MFKSVDRNILQPTLIGKPVAMLRDICTIAEPSGSGRRVLQVIIEAGDSSLNFVADVLVWSVKKDEWKRVASIHYADSKTLKKFSERPNRSVLADFAFFEEDHSRLIRIAAAVLGIGQSAEGDA